MEIQAIRTAASKIASLRLTHIRVLTIVQDDYHDPKEIGAFLKITPGRVRHILSETNHHLGVRNTLELAIVMYWMTISEDTKPLPPPGKFLCDILTKQEFKVAHLVADGCSNLAVAKTLGIPSVGTVKSHIRNITEKLGLSDRIEVALRVFYERFFNLQHSPSPTPH